MDDHSAVAGEAVFRDFMLRYAAAWDAYDLEAILDAYHTPCAIYKDGVQIANPDEATKRRYFGDLLERDRSAGEGLRRGAAEGHPIAPGSVGENLTTEGVELATLAPGTRLAFPSGLALEVSAPGNPRDVIRGSFLEGEWGGVSVLP